MQPVIIIPAYQPDKALITLVSALTYLQPLQMVIVVDDGSTTSGSKMILATVAGFSGVTLLTHGKNLGKGEALKTAFRYFLKNFPDSVGVVTADADGQHLPDDVKAVAHALMTTPDRLWLGTRNFSEDVPLRSRFGNILTRHVFSLFSGYTIRDTQTGLRGIPRSFIKESLLLPESGYAFEMQMLVLASEKKLQVGEVPISTIYIEQNRASHFRPVVDSLKIYFVFIRYTVLSLISALLDIVLFLTLFHFFKNILASIVTARLLSGIFNFFYCKKFIFKSTRKILPEAIHYFLLALVSVFFSYVLTSIFYQKLHLHIFTSKILADGMIFISNFLIQKWLIFRRTETA